MTVRPVRYDLDVQLDPNAHRLEGTTRIAIEPPGDEVEGRKRVVVEFELHPGLSVDGLELSSGTVRSHSIKGGRQDEDEFEPARHRVVILDPAGLNELVVSYGGLLEQDVEAGEQAGEIHNFAMRAHLGEDGVYLEPSGYWYPQFEQTLADYSLRAAAIDGFELVAGLEQQPAAADGRLQWASPFPLEGLVLLGGPLERMSSRHGDTMLHAVLAPGKQAVAADILAAAGEYLARYEVLLGPYPFSEFTVLEAFFSSGFAFPTCTQIVGSQLSEFKQYRRHGYLDHELLHNWWGNGVLVDSADGNWCEGLASYAGNYLGHVLDGDEIAARKQRRNQSNFLSRIDADNDLPLGTFGLEDGAGRGIGYQKGAAVFHMLARQIGREAFFSALRRLHDEYMGQYASWEDLQQVFELASGTELDVFFDQWVRRGGAPLLELLDAGFGSGDDHVHLTISQGETDFALDVPLRLHYDDRQDDIVVAIDEPVDDLLVSCETTGLRAIELDPDYHLFRKVEPEETMPTSALTRSGDRLLIVLPGESDGDVLDDGYQTLVDSFGRDRDDRETTTRHAAELGADELVDTAVLIVGGAVRRPAVSAFLERTRSPIEWTDRGFSVDGVAYDAAGHAVLITVHHPDDPTRGVTVYYGNSPDALANAGVLGYYPNSLLVFETPIDDQPATTASGMPRAEVRHRVDFEFHQRIEFPREP